MLAKIKNIDFVLLIVPVLLTTVGIALIYSLVFSGSGAELAIKQAIFFLIALALMFLMSVVDYRVLSGSSWYLYIAAIILLIVVDIFGKASGGATRWIDFKLFQIQPSEFYKFVSIIFLS
ncbi:MAG TPA: FtsW/RodA/SpoVE family cell cycle protein, partial [bacterium]|nr:FtsW/RodA/SpoVE family cell cycle protein [bacterium]